MTDVSISDFLSGSIGFDTCGVTPTKIVQNPVNGGRLPVSDLRRFVISHWHDDHLPAQVGSTLITASPAVEPIKERYKKFERRTGISVRVEIVEHMGYEPTEHYSIVESGRKKSAESYILFFGEDLVLIPESVYQRDDFRRYRKFRNGIVYRVPRVDAIQRPLSPKELPSGWYFADDMKIRRFGNVISKCVPSLEDEVVLEGGKVIYPKRATKTRLRSNICKERGNICKERGNTYG